MKKLFLVFIILIFFMFSCSTTNTINNDTDDDPGNVFIDEINEEAKEAVTEIIEEIQEEPADNSEHEISVKTLPVSYELSIADESTAETAAAAEISAEPETTETTEITDTTGTMEHIFQFPAILAQPPVTLLPRAQPPAAQTPPAAIQTQPPVVQTPPVAAQQPPVTQQPAAAQTPPPVVQPPVTLMPLSVTQTPPAQTLPLVQTPQIPQYTEPPAKTDPYQNEPFSNLPSAPAMGTESITQMGMTPQDSELIFSRIVRATVGQIVEIPFRGNGWVYLGELASRRGIVYNSRRNDPEGQSFIFTLEEAGVYIVKFYRQDFIRDYIINDHVQIIAGEAPAAASGWFNPSVDRGRVIAEPRWPSVFEEAQIRSGIRPDTEPVVSGAAAGSAATQAAAAQQETPAAPAAVQPPASQTPSSVSQAPSSVVSSNAAQSQPVINQQQSGADVSAAPERMPPDVILQRARESFDRGNVAGAISLLNQYMQFYPGGSDEVYWLMGQFYEASSPERNILLSIDSYRKLVNEYPQSTRFAGARSRIAYLERFYINIR